MKNQIINAVIGELNGFIEMILSCPLASAFQQTWQVCSEFLNTSSWALQSCLSSLFHEDSGEIPLLLQINNVHGERSFLAMKL